MLFALTTVAIPIPNDRNTTILNSLNSHMQTTLIIATLMALFSASSIGATLDAPASRPGGVAEVAWGSSIDDAKKAMLARPGTTLVSETKGKLTFAGGSFAEQPVENWELLFIAGKFSEASIRLKPLDALRQYEDIRKLITAKYRKAGREEKEGSEHRATYWEYSQTTGKWGIVCDVRIPNSLTIRYKDKSPSNQPGKAPGKDL